MSGFDEGEFTCDDYDDIVREVRNYTSKVDFSSPAAADRAVEDMSVRDLLEQIRETTERDIDFNPASLEPSGDLPIDTPSDTSPGVESPSGSGGGSNSHGSSGRGSRGGSSSRSGRGSRGGAAYRGGRLRHSVPLADQQRMHPIQELYVRCDVSHFTRSGSLRTSLTRTIATRSHSWNMHTP